MTNGSRKEYSQVAIEILTKFNADHVPEAITPELNAAPIIAIGYALLAINTSLSRITNEVLSIKTTLQHRPR